VWEVRELTLGAKASALCRADRSGRDSLAKMFGAGELLPDGTPLSEWPSRRRRDRACFGDEPWKTAPGDMKGARQMRAIGNRRERAMRLRVIVDAEWGCPRNLRTRSTVSVSTSGRA